MRNAYFVDNEEETVYCLNAKKAKELNNLFPNWNRFNIDSNYEDLQKVSAFFKEHGKLVACSKFRNVFVGLVD